MVKPNNRFAQYDGKRIAVFLENSTGKQVVMGEASYVTDRRLGKSLRIRLDEEFLEEGLYDVLLVESEWNGAILPDSEFGCDCCFIPQPLWARK
jgi:hypothetical protein